MKARTIVFPPILCIAAVAACSTGSPVAPPAFSSGEYAGTFVLTDFAGTDSARTRTQHSVSFSFTDTGWYMFRGWPSGSGRYEISGDTMTLTDLAAHTADFDWNLILSGSFRMQVRSDSLVLTQADLTWSRYRHFSLAAVE